MKKYILLTGATDGIGLETAKLLYQEGHHLLLHGRSPQKMEALETLLTNSGGNGSFESYLADLSDLNEVSAMAKAIKEAHTHLDVLINNAGVFKAPNSKAANGMDIRFVVNTLAPYLLAKQLMPLMNTSGRIVNLSSAAQSSVSLEAMERHMALPEMSAYAQSKLAITMWSRKLGQELKGKGPMVVSVNPGSLLASKMVREGFGVPGKDIMIGANILREAALSERFADAHGQYFDNDAGRFGPPHSDALFPQKVTTVVEKIEDLLKGLI